MRIAYLFFLIFIFINTSSLAQLEKGSWMLNGLLSQRNSSSDIVNTSNQFNLTLAPEVSLMVTNRLMLGGKLGINMSRSRNIRTTPVSQELHIRHYFKKLDNYYLFYGGKLRNEKNTIIPQGGRNRIEREQFAHIYTGLQVFLQQNIALEFLMDYTMLTRTELIGQGFFYGSDELRFSGRLQFFLHASTIKDTSAVDYRFRKGDWLIGGAFTLEDPNELQPVLLRFFKNGWAAGSRFNLRFQNTSTTIVTLGFYPLVRKYFFQHKKRKIFLQAGGGIAGNYFYLSRPDRPKKWFTNSRSITVEATIGWSTFINKNINLDFFISRDRTHIIPNGNRRSVRNFDVFSIGLAFQGILRR